MISSKRSRSSTSISNQNTKIISCDFWNEKSHIKANFKDSSFVKGLFNTIGCQAILFSVYGFKRLLFLKFDLKISCEFQPCADWEELLRSFNAYISYYLSWDFVFPASVAFSRYFSKQESNKILLVSSICMITTSCAIWCGVFLKDYKSAVAYSEFFEATAGYIGLIMVIGVNKKLKAVFMLLLINGGYTVCFYLMMMAFTSIKSGSLFQSFIFIIESFYSMIGRVPIEKFGWDPESFVMVIRICTGWIVGLKISGLFFYSHDMYEMFKYLALNSVFTIYSHTNLKGMINAWVVNNIARKRQSKFRLNGRSLGEKLFYGTFYETDWFSVCILFYLTIMGGGILSVPEIDQDQLATVPNSFIIDWKVFAIIILMVMLNEIVKYFVDYTVFRKNPQMIYYRLKNIKFRIASDFISYACVYFALVQGHIIRKNQTLETM